MMMNKLRTLALFVILLFVLVGCAGINVGNMVAADMSNGVKYPSTVAVTVNTVSSSGLWSGTVSPEDFRAAVIKSLEKCSMFKTVEVENISNYILKAEIITISSHPGFDMNGYVKVKWNLLERVKGATVWNAEIDTEGRAVVSEAFSGAARQNMALERGVKANIEQALKQIGELKL